MILPDVNVLVHAHNADSGTSTTGLRLWRDACLSGTEGIGLAWAAVLGFVRYHDQPQSGRAPAPGSGK